MSAVRPKLLSLRLSGSSAFAAGAMWNFSVSVKSNASLGHPPRMTRTLLYPGTPSTPSSSSSSSTSRRYLSSSSTRAPIRKGKVPAALSIPNHVVQPFYASNRNGHYAPRELDVRADFGQVKDADEIARMRVAAEIAASSLVEIDKLIRSAKGRSTPLTTSEIDHVAQQYVMTRGAYPVGVKFHGFPRAICTSVNEVVVHGVPDDEPLQPGDIINCDVSTYIDGAYGDTSKMFCVGGRESLRPGTLELCDHTRRAVEAAIALCKPGTTVADLGRCIYEYAKLAGCGIVPEFTGHFIGRELHMQPFVQAIPNDENLLLQPGMTFTIEPIFTNTIIVPSDDENSSAKEARKGSMLTEIEGPWNDGWTYVTKDGSWSAQYEHTVLITEGGCEVLTRSEIDEKETFA
ncbi:unnamed protein product [Amoebophrya sp. A25]|nr:unnamed protein product [Amoebophrya sp. A25]|eukprot:GSA25T00004395001.1